VAELVIIALGTAVSALSSFFAWQAASSSAEQAKYAHEALFAADANQTFRTYIASWNKLCSAIAQPNYNLSVGTPSFDDHNNLSVSASNSGFDPAAFDIDAYNDRINTAEIIVRDNLLEFQTFLPEDIFARTEQALTVTAYFYIMSVGLEDPDELKTRLIRASALCQYYTQEQLRWFKDKSYKIAPVIFALTSMKIEYTEDLPPTRGTR
jgi:hypothetical protein